MFLIILLVSLYFLLKNPLPLVVLGLFQDNPNLRVTTLRIRVITFRKGKAFADMQMYLYSGEEA